MKLNEMWGYTAQTSEWLRGLECFQSSVAQHLSPHGSFAAEETCGSCLVCPYLGMADELWQLMSEQPVKESACNEESAAWETDAIIFQIKLFPCCGRTSSGRLNVPVAVTWWVILRSLSVCLSEWCWWCWWWWGEANILALPTHVKMWFLHI